MSNDEKSPLFDELMQGMQEARAHARGELPEGHPDIHPDIPPGSIWEGDDHQATRYKVHAVEHGYVSFEPMDGSGILVQQPVATFLTGRVRHHGIERETHWRDSAGRSVMVKAVYGDRVRYVRMDNAAHGELPSAEFLATFERVVPKVTIRMPPPTEEQLDKLAAVLSAPSPGIPHVSELVEVDGETYRPLAVVSPAFEAFIRIDDARNPDSYRIVRRIEVEAFNLRTVEERIRFAFGKSVESAQGDAAWEQALRNAWAAEDERADPVDPATQDPDGLGRIPGTGGMVVEVGSLWQRPVVAGRAAFCRITEVDGDQVHYQLLDHEHVPVGHASTRTTDFVAFHKRVEELREAPPGSPGTSPTREADWYEQLDPGIRDTVFWLHAHGFQTTDSGDGRTKFEAAAARGEPMEVDDPEHCVLDFPHVAISVRPDRLVSEADRLFGLLINAGVEIGPIGPGREPSLEASYDPGNPGRSSILLCNVVLKAEP